MRLYPDTTDQAPMQTRFWVKSREGGIMPTEVVTETPAALEKRLERDFPVYRAVQIGKRLMAGLIGSDDEV